MSLVIPATNLPINLDDFSPFYTPQEVLLMGAFGGSYFNKVSYRVNLPPDLFYKVPFTKYSRPAPVASANYFGLLVPKRSRQMEIPIGLRLIDQEGWFQWYCNYYYGRRHEVDVHRILQWKQELTTLFYYIKNATYGGTGNRLTDLLYFKDWRQQILHFAWDPTIDPITYGINKPS